MQGRMSLRPAANYTLGCCIFDLLVLLLIYIFKIPSNSKLETSETKECVDVNDPCYHLLESTSLLSLACSSAFSVHSIYTYNAVLQSLPLYVKFASDKF
jgi:hypothetical protein